MGLSDPYNCIGVCECGQTCLPYKPDERCNNCRTKGKEGIFKRIIGGKGDNDMLRAMHADGSIEPGRKIWLHRKLVGEMRR